MSASRLPESACPSCGEELPPYARFCPTCGVKADEEPPLETVPGPVARVRVRSRWLGLPAEFVLLCLTFAALGAAAGLFATGGWAWGGVSLCAAATLFAALVAAQSQDGWTERPSRLAAAGRAQATTAAAVWRARLDAAAIRTRTRPRLERLDSERAPALQALGAAVWEGRDADEREARARLEELDRERDRVESDLAGQLASAEERIRRARLPVEETMMVAPEQPRDPYPPPGEADPPQPARIPEPYPPPDEGTPPPPAPGPEEE